VNEDFPKLRPLDLVPIQASGRQMVALRDPLGLSEQTVVVDDQTFFLLRFFDGAHSKLDIKTEYARRFGGLLFGDKLDALIEKLDTALLLDNERFRSTRDDIERSFAESPSRPAFLAGKSYPTDPDDLKTMLKGFFDEAGGGKERKGTLRAVVAPHIDIRRGGRTFAVAYREIERSDADTFVVLGVDHQGMEGMFCATRKPFETPLGTVETDGDALDALEKGCGKDFFAHESAHRMEHSIEFQAVFLRYVFPERSIRIVPVLCGGFEAAILAGKSPKEDPALKPFTRALRDIVRDRSDSLVVIAGADLSHMGRRFGDPNPVSLPSLEAQDRSTLKRAESIDAQAFYKDIAKDGNRRAVCGLPAIYTLLATTDATEGVLLEYAQWPEKETGSVVTGAGMAFYRTS
jgi:AmmeMemoRadiSam system protein B